MFSKVASALKLKSIALDDEDIKALAESEETLLKKSKVHLDEIAKAKKDLAKSLYEISKQNEKADSGKSESNVDKKTLKTKNEAVNVLGSANQGLIKLESDFVLSVFELLLSDENNSDQARLLINELYDNGVFEKPGEYRSCVARFPENY